ncbi:MAG: hypothetical protein ACQEQD_04635 [Bacillota bacterium]
MLDNVLQIAINSKEEVYCPITGEECTDPGVINEQSKYFRCDNYRKNQLCLGEILEKYKEE